MEICTRNTGFLNLINQKSAFCARLLLWRAPATSAPHEHSMEAVHPRPKVVEAGRWGAPGRGPLTVGTEVWGETLVPGGVERKKKQTA